VKRINLDVGPATSDDTSNAKVTVPESETANAVDPSKDIEMTSAPSNEKEIAKSDEGDVKTNIEAANTPAATAEAEPTQVTSPPVTVQSPTHSHTLKDYNDVLIAYNQAQSELQGNAPTESNTNTNIYGTNNGSTDSSNNFNKDSDKIANNDKNNNAANNDSGNSDNEDSIVVNNRLRSPPKRTRAGRFVKKTSISKSPAYSYRRKGSDF